MLNDRVFRIQAVSDIVVSGLGAHAFVGIKAAPGKVDSVAKWLSGRDDVGQITRVLNGFDLIVVMIAPDRQALLTGIIGEIALAPGVRSTETFDTVATLKHAYAWTWIV
jgi:DNA-binding Lrp family transcriptional regulator